MSTRRDFLKVSGLASTALLMPQFLQALAPMRPHQGERKLVIIQQSGGNDGLNAWVPYRNDDYFRARPRLAIAAKDVIPLTDELGLNPALAPLQALYDAGDMTLINQVGYPNPDRSHFRAMDIWHTGSGADAYWKTGWLGRYLDHHCQGQAVGHQVLEIDDTLSLSLKGAQHKGIALRNPKRLYRQTRSPWLDQIAATNSEARHAEPLAYLYKTLTETQQSAAYLFEKSQAARRTISYPNSRLARDLKTVADLICNGVDTAVFYVSLSGFDTHVAQRRVHDRLLGQYAEAVATFQQDLAKAGWWDRTLVLTFSEFGRRVAENASAGTDHGKANSLTLMGGALKEPGMFNDLPDLGKLDEGDLPYQVDFRQVYATVLRDWLAADDQAILQGSYAPLPLV